MAHGWGTIGYFALGAIGAIGCSHSASHPGSSNQSGTGGCPGAPCGAGPGRGGMGGATGSGASGTGGTAGGGGAVGVGGTTGGAGATGAGGGAGSQPTTCMTLSIAAGTMAADGVLALHAPPAGALGNPYGRSLVVANGFVYFGFGKDLTRAPLAGGMSELIHSRSSPDQLFFVIGSDIVWVDYDSKTMVYSILKAPVSPAGGTASVVAGNIDEPGIVVSDSTAIYFANNAKKVFYKAPLDGSGVTQLAANADPLGAVVATGNLYWLDFATSQLMSIPTGGGKVTALISVFFGGPMVAEGSTLYWNDTSNRSINRWSPGEKNLTKLAVFETFKGAGDIAAKDGDVYYTHEGFGCGGIGRIPGDGSKSSIYAQDFDSASNLALDADSVYVAASNGVFKVHR